MVYRLLGWGDIYSTYNLESSVHNNNLGFFCCNVVSIFIFSKVGFLSNELVPCSGLLDKFGEVVWFIVWIISGGSTYILRNNNHLLSDPYQRGLKLYDSHIMDFSPFYLVVEMKKNGAELLWCFLGAGTKVKQSKHCFCILELTKINKKLTTLFSNLLQKIWVLCPLPLLRKKKSWFPFLYILFYAFHSMWLEHTHSNNHFMFLNIQKG